MKYRSFLFSVLLFPIVNSAYSAQAEDVVMRRPLPFKREASQQNDCQLNGTCTPPPSCFGDNPGPDCPVSISEPQDPVGNDDGDYAVDFNIGWHIGPWQSEGSCGNDDSRIHREVSCQAYSCNSDYTQCEYRVIDSSRCSGTAPVSEIRGKTMNCQYDLAMSAWSQWDSMCSLEARRTRTARCTDAQGREVDVGYCQYDFTNGQTQETDVTTTEETANYEGCPLEWKYHYEGCSANGSDCYYCGGDPVRFRGMNYVARCTVSAEWMGPDGTQADWTPLAQSGETDEDVCIRKGYGPRPDPDESDLKQCNTFNNSGPMQTCSGEVISETTRPYTSGNVFQEGYEICSAAGAGCMAVHGDPRDSNPQDMTPGNLRNFHISCHKGYGRTGYTGPATFSEAGPATISQYSAPYPSLAPAYEWKKVPRNKIGSEYLYHSNDH